jgi:serine/threonine-protein kinase
MNDLPSRLTSALADRYSIERQLGEGGMATVYLAKDLRHNRQVALKVLKPELAAVVGAERFLAEIETTANLQHPHILPLFDSGEADGFLFYVMPYVEGETLRDRLDREKQLPVDEAVRIAIAVGNALAYAHRREIIHRDIKPANILLQDGEPVVADFGIALAVNAAGGARMTETGLSIGTPHYMSPEQASGDRVIDGRSDVYALAAMLYEMLTGDPPFQGSTAQAVLARILTEKPTSVTQVRDSTPYHVAAAVDRALAKLPADRFSTASHFVEALKRGEAQPPAAAQPSVNTSTASGPAVDSRRRRLILVATVVLSMAAAAIVGRITAPTAAPQVVRATLSFADYPEIVAVENTTDGTHTAVVTPDGRTVVFMARTRTGSAVFRRDLDTDAPEIVVGAEGGSSLEVSPDGANLLFTRNTEAYIVPLGGGVPRPVDGLAYGADWAVDGYLYGLAADLRTLVRVPDNGGPADTVALPDSAYSFSHPQLLPGGRTLLVTHVPESANWNSRAVTAGVDGSTLQLVDMQSGERRDLTPGFGGMFVPPDLLVYAGPAGPTYVRMDPRRGEIVGAAQPFLQGAWGFDLTLSPTGHLVYLKETGGGDQVVFVDRAGNEQEVVAGPTRIGSAVVSPDGGRVLVSQGSRLDLWVYELSGEAPTRLTFGDGDYDHPAWSGDGRYAWMSNGNGPGSDLYRVTADGLGSPELVRDESVAVFDPVTVPGGRWVAFYENRTTSTGRDILAFPAESPEDAQEIVATPANERAPALSPDERFLAYVSDITGTDEVYVTRFPSGEGRWQVSSGGGWEPVWSPDGRRLYFRTAESYMESDVATQDGFRLLRTRALFPAGRFSVNSNLRHWNLHPDGERFVMVRVTAVPPALEIILNAATQLTGGS